MFLAPQDHPVLSPYSSITLQCQTALDSTESNNSKDHFAARTCWSCTRKRQGGTYKELRKKKIKLQKDAPNFFYYSWRRSHAFRSRSAADTTLCISSFACNLAHKVCKSHFTESYNKKIVCISQRIKKRNNLCHTKLIFMLSFTCSHL